MRVCQKLYFFRSLQTIPGLSSHCSLSFAGRYLGASCGLCPRRGAVKKNQEFESVPPALLNRCARGLFLAVFITLLKPVPLTLAPCPSCAFHSMRRLRVFAVKFALLFWTVFHLRNCSLYPRLFPLPFGLWSKNLFYFSLVGIVSTAYFDLI